MASKASMKPIRRYDHRGGVNMTVAASLVPENQFADMRNWTLDETGILTKRKGRSTWASGAGNEPCKGLFRFYKSDGTKKVLCVFGTTVYYVDDEDEGRDNLTALVTDWDATNPTFFVTWKDVVIMCNGVDTPKAWDGEDASATDITDAPANFIPCVHNNRLLIAKNSEIAYSELDDYETWSTSEDAGTSGFLNIFKDDGQKITGLVSHAGGLLILKERSICYLYGFGPDEWTTGNRKEIEGIGCIAPMSVASGMAKTFFLGRDGVYIESGRSIYLVSKPIEPLFRELSVDDLAGAWGVYHQGKYYLSIPAESGGPNELLLAFDIEESERQGAPVWEPYGTIGGNGMASLTNTGDLGYLIVGASRDTGELYRAFHETTDAVRSVTMMGMAEFEDEAHIDAYAKTGRILGDQYDLWFSFHEIWIDADFPSGASLDIEWTAFQNRGETKTGTKTLTKPGRASMPTTCQGRDLQLLFRANDDLDGWKFRGYTVRPEYRRANRP